MGFLQEFLSITQISYQKQDDSDLLSLESCILEKWMGQLFTLTVLLIGQWQNSGIRTIKKLVAHENTCKTELEILSLHFQTHWWDVFSYALTLNSDNFSTATWSWIWVEHPYNVAKILISPHCTTNGIFTHYCEVSL